VDGIRGLQYTEHSIDRPDQMLRNNLVLAGENAVAADAVVARLLGFNPLDIDFLHMGAARGLGTLDMNQIEVVGDELDRLARPWVKPRSWYARCNREWAVTNKPESGEATWKRHTSTGDTLYFAETLGGPAPAFAAAAKVRADGIRKGSLWLGLTGKVTVTLNGVNLLEDRNTARHRVGQIQHAVELRPGENRFLFRVESVGDKAPLLSAVLIGPINNGDSLEGTRWTA
jgi:hypothetical protein